MITIVLGINLQWNTCILFKIDVGQSIYILFTLFIYDDFIFLHD